MERFGDLLSEAIQRIRLCEANKPVSVIQDELGYALGRDGGSAIAYWRKGHSPKIADLEKLAREISRRSDLDAGWLRRFLHCADYPYVEDLVQELFPRVATLALTPPFEFVIADASNLSLQKPYSELIGREEIIGQLLSKLSNPTAHPLVGVDGIGGIGKTALLYEVAQRVRKRHLFDAVVWIDAAGGSQHDATTLTFSSVLNVLSRQLRVAVPLQSTDEELFARLQALLRRHRVLLVLDNLETAGQPQDDLIRQLLPLFGVSRGLLASRQRFMGDFYALHLPGLDFTSVMTFIRQEANVRGLLMLEATPQQQLHQIFLATGGSPLAMKLVVGQLSFLPLEIILGRLQADRAVVQRAIGNEYQLLYTHIFMPAWDLLSEVGKCLLLAMTLFVPGLGVNLETIQQVSGLPSGELFLAINELWRLSLMEVGKEKNGNLSDKRYYLHALTQNFIHIIGLEPVPLASER